MKATWFAYRSHCSTNILQWETQSPFTKTEMGRHWEMNKNFKAHVVKWIKSPWAVANVHPKRTWRSYNREPVARTKNTLLQLVMEKVTHQIQMGTSLLMPEVFKEFDPLLSKKWEKWTVIATTRLNLWLKRSSVVREQNNLFPLLPGCKLVRDPPVNTPPRWVRCARHLYIRAKIWGLITKNKLTPYEVFIVVPVTPQDTLATIPKHVGY